MKANTALKWMAYAAVLVWVAVGVIGCATTDRAAITQSVSEKAGIITYTYLPTYRTEIALFCAMSEMLSKQNNPAEAQKYLQDQIAKLWVAGGDTGAWLVATTLNDFVRFTGLSTAKPTSDTLKSWIAAVDAFCCGVQMAGK